MVYVHAFWTEAKKTLKLIWRHFFTLIDISLSLNVLLFDTLIWKNALISLAVAITIDWVKQYIKFTPNIKNHPHHNDPSKPLIPPLHEQWWNPSIRGTPAYFMRHMGDRYN